MPSVEALLAVAIDNIEDLKNEVAHNRASIHELRSTVQGVAMLRAAVNELQEQMPNLARRAAREAVAEDRRRRHADTFANFRTYAAVLSAGVALGAFIVALATGHV